MIETVDAEPLVFDFSKSGAASSHASAHGAPSSYAAAGDDAQSLYSTSSNFTTYSYAAHDDDLLHHHQLDPDDLKRYIALLGERPYEFLPPVQEGGLPPLEAMNIPHYDPVQYNYNPNKTQRATKMAEARRGPKYMLTYLHRKMRYSPPRTARARGSGGELRPAFSNASAISMGTAATTLGTLGASTHTVTLSTPLTPPPPLPKVPPGYASSVSGASQAPKTSSTPSIFSKLKQRMVASRAPPSPVASPQGSDHEAAAVDTVDAAAVSPTSSHNIDKKPGSSKNQVKPVSSLPTHHAYVPPHHDPHKKRTPSLFSVASSLRHHHLAPSRTAGGTPASPIQRIKKTHKYLANMGTIRLRGGDKRPFEIIVDPRFPHSYLDMDALIRESASATEDHQRKFNLLAASFEIVATPVYNAESEYNRVCIDIELVPRNLPADDLAGFERYLYGDEEATGNQEEEENTGDANEKADQVGDLPRRRLKTRSFFSNSESSSASALGKKRTFNNAAAAGFSLYAPNPLPTQQPKPSTKPCIPLATKPEETAADKAQRIQNEAFVNQWHEDSKSIITLMPLSPYNCVLGRDWLAALYNSAYKK